MGSSSSSLLIRLKEEMCCELKDCSRRTYDLKERRAEERPYTKFPRNWVSFSNDPLRYRMEHGILCGDRSIPIWSCFSSKQNYELYLIMTYLKKKLITTKSEEFSIFPKIFSFCLKKYIPLTHLFSKGGCPHTIITHVVFHT